MDVADRRCSRHGDWRASQDHERRRPKRARIHGRRRTAIRLRQRRSSSDAPPARCGERRRHGPGCRGHAVRPGVVARRVPGGVRNRRPRPHHHLRGCAPRGGGHRRHRAHGVRGLQHRRLDERRQLRDRRVGSGSPVRSHSRTRRLHAAADGEPESDQPSVLEPRCSASCVSRLRRRSRRCVREPGSSGPCGNQRRLDPHHA